jgi:ABC-type lipoprotein export system ATPase subunit
VSKAVLGGGTTNLAGAPDGQLEPVVQLRDVFCVHRTNEGDAAALQGLSLNLAQGELLCVLGPSGAGKTTLLRVIGGLQTPSAGVVRVLGFDIGRLPAGARARLRRAAIGSLDQHAESALAPDLRVGQRTAPPRDSRPRSGSPCSWSCGR